MQDSWVDAPLTLHDEEAIEPSRPERLHARLVRVPLQTMTLPPATRTNAYLARGVEGWWVVDPGADDRTQLTILQQAIYGRPDDAPIVGAILTHEHGDHVAGLPWFHDTFGGRVVAHPRTIERLRGGFYDPGVIWEACAGIDDDATPDGPAGLDLLHTPGHAAGHVVVRVLGGPVLAGDLIAGVGTILVEPPAGDMDDYLRSLMRVHAWIQSDTGAARTLLPAHGPASLDGVVRLDAYHAHRLRREARVLRALDPVESRPLDDVTARAYAELSPMMHPLARGSAHAHLLRLVGLGQAVGDEEQGWRLGVR